MREKGEKKGEKKGKNTCKSSKVCSVFKRGEAGGGKRKTVLLEGVTIQSKQEV